MLNGKFELHPPAEPISPASKPVTARRNHCPGRKGLKSCCFIRSKAGAITSTEERAISRFQCGTIVRSDMPKCTHTNQIKEVTPHAQGCEDCLKTGDRWVHLRLCMSCGHVGCCDS